MSHRLARDPAYRRLRPGRRTPSGHLSCWLATDHLLVVQTLGYAEQYRRFDLKDIQAVVLNPSPWRWILLLCSALTWIPLVGVASWAAFTHFDNPSSDWAAPVAISAAILSVFPLLILVGCAVSGSLARIRIVTGVQSTTLPGLFNQTRARAFAAELQSAAIQRLPPS
jgi:hypothetical protein